MPEEKFFTAADDETIPERLIAVCRGNFFDDIAVAGNRLSCTIPSFDARYHLEARAEHGMVTLRLSDVRPAELDCDCARFLAAHGETDYPLTRRERRDADWQEVLDDLQSAADDLFGLLHDLAEARHQRRSADAALARAVSFRDTPYEHALLDSRLVDTLRDHRCAWYPSCDTDFRDLLFLSGEYPGIACRPELFIHTDCCPNLEFAPGQVVHEDEHTRVTLEQIDSFTALPIPELRFCHFRKPELLGKVFDCMVRVESDRFGTIRQRVVYAVCENEWFAANLLIPNRVAVEAVCHVRYGAGFGGANNSGAWLVRTLRALHAKWYVSDPSGLDHDGGNLDAVFREFPQLDGIPAEFGTPAATIPGKYWSNHGDVSVYPLLRS